MIFKSLKLVSTICVAFLISGCAAKTYVQKGTEGLEDSELAIFYLPDPVFWGAAIEKVDGEYRGFGIHDRFRLLPGNHCLTFVLNNPNFKGKGKGVRCFDAFKGRIYTAKVRINIELKTWGIAILDFETKETIETTGNGLVENDT